MSSRNSLFVAVVLLTLIGLGLLARPGATTSPKPLRSTFTPTPTILQSPSSTPQAVPPALSTPMPFPPAAPIISPAFQQLATLPRATTTSLTVINHLGVDIKVTLSGPQALTFALAADETKNFDIMPGTYHYRIDAAGYDSLEGNIAWPNTNPWEWTIIP